MEPPFEWRRKKGRKNPDRARLGIYSVREKKYCGCNLVVAHFLHHISGGGIVLKVSIFFLFFRFAFSEGGYIPGRAMLHTAPPEIVH